VKNPYEDETTFIKRVNDAMRDDDDKGKRFPNESKRWVIGSQNRNVGSIHSDLWDGSAGELAESNKIIVYPITGWWKTRPHLKQFNEVVRYALVVSIETPETEIDLYQAIKVEIDNKVPIKTEITAI